jgi:hypothetical protein
VAAERGKVDILDKLWDLAKEVLNRDDLNNKVVFAKDYEEKTVLNHASLSGDIPLLERIWNLTKEQLSPEEFNKLLLSQNN